MPKNFQKLAFRNAHFHIMDAASLASKFGRAGRIDVICMIFFFCLLGRVLPLDDAISLSLLKTAIKMTYGYKGDGVVKKTIELLETIVSDPQSLIFVCHSQSMEDNC